MVWNEETVLRLKELWAQGHSTAEIGRRLAVSKNAIVGKAHRLDLTARPSPIRRDRVGAANERPQPAHWVQGPTLPPLASTSAPPVASNVQAIRPAAAAAAQPPVSAQRPLRSPPSPAPPVRAMAPPSPPMPHRRSAPSCCWPIGEPGKRDFRFCDDPSLPGKPYCEDHAKLAYVKIRDRKEDAA